MSGKETLVDRLPVLLSSFSDEMTKLLGVPALNSGTGHAAADAVYAELKSWNCESKIVAMCFDIMASNTGKFAGARELLEELIGHNLLRVACRHHMLVVLLSDVFTVCFGPSTGPEVLIFKEFREKWSKLNHHEPLVQGTLLITAPDELKNFIRNKLREEHVCKDCKEFLHLAGLHIGMNIECNIRKPGAIHRARWMAKAIYSLKMELLHEGNEAVLQLTARAETI